VSAIVAGWRGTPLPEWFGSWWTFAAIVAIVAAGAWLLFRSLRRWKQPPPGSDPSSVQADQDLKWITYRNMPG
jgi:hypothetical protein